MAEHSIGLPEGRQGDLCMREKAAFEDQGFHFDHIAIPVGKGNLEAAYTFFKEFLGGTLIYNPGVIGDGFTGMKTVVVRIGSVDLALMEGADGRRDTSQISYYEDGHDGDFGQGPWGHQHIAIACSDIRRLAYGLRERGVRFLTEFADRSPKILYDKDEAGGVVLQVFTYPIGNGRFFEFKQKIGEDEKEDFEQFRDNNVKNLWTAVDAKIKELGWTNFTKLNIFGELSDLGTSLIKRGVSIDRSLCEK